MITHVIKSPEDEKIINELSSKSIIVNAQPDNYRGIVVPKPWGIEFLCYEDNCIAAWFLSIDKGHSTSMHCHPNKRTVLIILSGIALGRTLHGSAILNPGKIVVYEPGVFHATKSLTGIEMAEIESPNWKGDLLRYNDNYDRVGIGYEDKKTFTKSCEAFYLDSTNPVFSKSHYSISKGDTIKCGEINIIGENLSDIAPNTCILDDQDRIFKNSNILRFKFPNKENRYECCKHI